MEVRIKHIKGHQAQAYARFHRVTCDQSFEDGGSDTGMMPPELMLASLGTCAMHYADEYLSARGLPEGAVELKVTASKGGHPVRLAEIGIEVLAPGLGARARAGLLKAIEACLLHRTLADPPRVKIAIAEAPAAVQMAV